jgi:hypothetical protein
MRSLALIFVVAACDDRDRLHPAGPVTHPSTLLAMETLPTGLALHEKVIHRSCSPAGGVCHNGKEYPDLHTIGNLIAALDKPCNRDKADEPESIFDGCEPEGDELVVMRPSGGELWRTKIALFGAEEYNFNVGTLERSVELESDAPQTIDRSHVVQIQRGGTKIVELPLNLIIEAGERTGRLVDLFNLDYRIYLDLAKVRGGDPNANGAFGSEKPWKMVAAGYPFQSYLFGRITGLVPGSRMPLANKPLTDAEYIAIFCWIETLDADPDPADPIDYESCTIAREPLSFSR